MVSLGAGEICVHKYRGIYYFSAAVCYDHRSDMFCLFAGPYGLFACAVFYRFCSGRLYHPADLVGSAMMISLGIIGYYISKIYEEVKRRPRYIISKVIKNGNIQD